MQSLFQTASFWKTKFSLGNMKMGKSKLSPPPHSASEWKQMPCFVDLSTGVVWMGSDVGQWQAVKQSSEELKYMVDVQYTEMCWYMVIE